MAERPQAELAPRVALSLVPHLGGRTLARLLQHFGTVEAILDASEAELCAVPRVGTRLARAIAALDLAQTEGAIRRWQQQGLLILSSDDDDYPAALQPLDDAPPVLFLRGSLAATQQPVVAIVGTRHPSPRARSLAEAGAHALAAQGWTIVSGLATGVDAAAHHGALQASGRTIAVLGSGVACVYPYEHRALAQRIVERGALVAEVQPDARPSSTSLVARNRIISGLSRAVIVVEAGASSGSLHAARFAQAQGRPVFAVSSRAAGNQQLLTDGALPLPDDAGSWPGRLVQFWQQG